MMPCFKRKGKKDKKKNKISNGYSYSASVQPAEETKGALSCPPPKKIVSRASVKNLGKLFKELECPVCYNTCTPPIETCKNGHIICTNCRALMNNCPTCRERFTGTRNFFAENFINQYAQYCKFKSEGCEYLRWKGENMSPHEATCQFRNIDCMVPSCPKPLPYSSLLDHLVKDHKIGGSEKLPTKISFDVFDPIVSTRKWLPYFIKSHGNVYYVMMEVIRPSFYIWIWLQETKKVTPSSQDNDFTHVASIRLQSPDKRMNFNWEGPVHSIRTPAVKIREHGLCLVVPETMMQHFEKDSHISLVLDIERRKVDQVPSVTVTKQNIETDDEIPDEIFHPPSTNPMYPDLSSSEIEPLVVTNNNTGPVRSPG